MASAQRPRARQTKPCCRTASRMTGGDGAGPRHSRSSPAAALGGLLAAAHEGQQFPQEVVPVGASQGAGEIVEEGGETSSAAGREDVDGTGQVVAVLPGQDASQEEVPGLQQGGLAHHRNQGRSARTPRERRSTSTHVPSVVSSTR